MDKKTEHAERMRKLRLQFRDLILKYKGELESYEILKVFNDLLAEWKDTNAIVSPEKELEEIDQALARLRDVKAAERDAEPSGS